MKLSEDALKDVNEKPSTLPQLPWYFMRKILALDSTVRETGSAIKVKFEKETTVNHDTSDENEESDDSEESDEGEESEMDSDSSSTNSTDEESEGTDGENENAIHPLDLIYAIFMCADDFLRQELVDKMSKCQYAVPLILPSPDGNGTESQNQILHWGLQTISKTYREGDSSVTKTMVNVECPLVSCLQLGDNVPWKLKILNEMLGKESKNFWHEGLEGGDRIQKFSKGMVEVSWHLPGGRGRETDKFNTPVTFANLRGDATRFKLVTEQLSKLSTITCIFTQTTKNIHTFLKKTFRRGWSKRVIVVLLYKPDDKNKIQRRLKNLRKKLKLKEHEIISYPIEENQFFNTHTKLLETLQTSINNKTNKRKKSLSSLVNDLKSVMKVDDKECYDGHMAAQSILADIDEIGSQRPHNVKLQVLPCQSDTETREKIGKHDKETCRYRDISEKEDIEQYASRKKEEKWQLQWQQLQHPMSKTFVNFLKYIVTFNSLHRKYFLRSLKLGLDERSAEILQPLYVAYEKSLREEESVQKRKKLNEHMAQSSLGLEHFFREMAVMYENMMALREKNGKKVSQLDSVLSTLTQCMADILLDGEAIELLDGDIAHSHVLWLTAVINEIENRKLIRIFKVSTLGAQSCGKSTLLNTMFGLNFPVSTGRCTRGAYMQLVNIDENLSKQLQCDYLLVIDSEGLMSRVSKNEDYDNELATFVIGLSDLTLVFIKGEGKEMEDVLPIAIHVFLRMNVLGELQACHFVHQNMGAVDVKRTMPIEIDAFVKLLDEKTQTAAEEAGEQNYTRFTDTLHYDHNTDNTYLCHLWVGTPPMGKANREYSYTTQRLKTKILERVKHVTEVTKEKGCSTLVDFSKWLQEIWKAVKYENFVFSFRNVLAMETYKRISKIFNDKQWKIKKNMRQSMELTKKQIKDETLTKPEKGNDRLKIQNMKKKADQDVNSNTHTLLESIMHYFKCSGCTECSPEVRNRHFLKDYRSGFEHDIGRFGETLKEEMNQSVENLRVELAASIELNRLSSQMDTLIKKEVQELIEKMMSQSLAEVNTRESFDGLWTNVEEEILKKINPKEKQVYIKASVQSVITNLLGPDVHRYHRKKSGSRIKIAVKVFVVKDSHMTRGNLTRLRERTETFIEQANAYCRTVTEDKQYEAKDSEMLFNDILSRIKQLKEEGIDTSLDYKVDLMIYMEELAVRIFTWNQNKYEEQNGPFQPSLRRKKKFIMTFL